MPRIDDPPTQETIDRMYFSRAWTESCCEVDGCLGIQAEENLCFAHLDPGAAMERLKHQVSAKEIDFRGVELDDDLCQRLFFALRDADPDSPPEFHFAAAVFKDDVELDLRFGVARFDGCRFKGQAEFFGAWFDSSAWFDAAQFEQGARFDVARFKADARFINARFSAEASFAETIFRGEVSFDGAEFHGPVDFQRATFDQAQWLGPLAALDSLDFARASFGDDLVIEASAPVVRFRSTRFSETVTLRLRWAAVSLESVVLARPSVLTPVPHFPEEEVSGHADEEICKTATAARAAVIDAPSNPCVVSLQGSNVAELTVANADLSACRFTGTRNLDSMRLEGEITFARAPALHSSRRALAEEHEWRARRKLSIGPPTWLARRRSAAWFPPECHAPDGFESRQGEVGPDTLAAIYRGLRKSLEDGKDEPGAADFYYGEMEMRRHSSRTPRIERIIIWLYWLVSGYGLRASRSLLALAGLLAISAAFYAESGLADGGSYIDGLLYSIRSVSLFPQPDAQPLTQEGEAAQVLLRVFGPVLVALTALAIRARLKR